MGPAPRMDFRMRKHEAQALSRAIAHAYPRVEVLAFDLGRDQWGVRVSPLHRSGRRWVPDIFARVSAVQRTYPTDCGAELACQEGHKGGRAENNQAPMPAQAGACT